MKLRVHILVFLLVFGLTPLLLAVAINLPLVLDRTALFYQRAYLQNLRADFRDLDQHLASRHEMIRLLAKLPEPGLILGEQGEAEQIDLARARYTGWINQILSDQRDIIQLLFLGSDGQKRFWLTRDPRNQTWRPTAEPPQLPNPRLIDTALSMDLGAVMVSRIRVDLIAGAEDPRQLITLDLVSRIGAGGVKSNGVVVMVLDVGGLAQFYRDTVWVNQDGSYLRPGEPADSEPSAFADFPGLDAIFAGGKLALWRGPRGRQLLWVPMFLTEEGVPLWVARAVDPSPIDDFRNALMLRVLSIILILVVVVLILARWIAARAEHFGQVLTGGIRQILHDGKPLRFHWRGPREVGELGDQLTALAQTHAEHLRASREHTKELERSNRYKSEFLANVSHELRTPLNSILLLSKMLSGQGSGLTEGQRRQAQVIHEAGKDLRTMIDNILDISRIEAGHVATHLEWVELPPVLEELVELMAPVVADKPVRLSLEIDPGAPRRIFSDRDKLRQILKNFLSNAAKFTKAGRVTLSLGPRPSPDHALVISVADTGIGIPSEKQQIIFEAFQQADGSTRRRYGGTGLGLSISRELAGLLGGRIEVESAPGAGSRFDLLLPIRAPGGQGAGEPDPVDTHAHASAQPGPSPVPADTSPGEDPVPTPAMLDPSAHWVLIIDRDVRNLVQLAALINRRGLAVQTAADLDEALETLQDDQEGCALILLAAPSSPQQTCDTITTLLKQNPERAVAIAVMGSPEQQVGRDRWQLAGAIGFLPKPVESTTLDGLLDNLPDACKAAGPLRLEDAAG